MDFPQWDFWIHFFSDFQTLYTEFELHKVHPRGLLISELNFGVFKSPKKANQILHRFLLYEATAEICQKFGWLLGRFEDTKNSFWD